VSLRSTDSAAAERGPAAAPAPPRETWREALFNRRMLICVFTGFSSGLPLWLLVNLLPAWLRTSGVDLKTIGALTLVQAPYVWKFAWSPFVDRYALPMLGRRRGWMLATQLALLALIVVLGTVDPGLEVWTLVAITLAIAFVSATMRSAARSCRMPSSAWARRFT
jgi:PAT family beta-lactamase induction signal transducer AmpG